MNSKTNYVFYNFRSNRSFAICENVFKNRAGTYGRGCRVLETIQHNTPINFVILSARLQRMYLTCRLRAGSEESIRTGIGITVEWKNQWDISV
jgi:hypothetical protein